MFFFLNHHLLVHLQSLLSFHMPVQKDNMLMVCMCASTSQQWYCMRLGKLVKWDACMCLPVPCWSLEQVTVHSNIHMWQGLVSLELN